MTLRGLWTDLGHLDGGILGNDSCPTARGVQKHSVKAIHDLKTPAPWCATDLGKDVGIMLTDLQEDKIIKHCVNWPWWWYFVWTDLVKDISIVWTDPGEDILCEHCVNWPWGRYKHGVNWSWWRYIVWTLCKLPWGKIYCVNIVWFDLCNMQMSCELTLGKM